MEIYKFKDKLPEKEHYHIYHYEDGSIKYYLTSMNSLYKFIALYGIPSGTWTYTPDENCKIYR